METRRPTKTKVLPGALAGIVTIAVLGVFSSAAPFLTDGTALAAHSGLSPGGDPDEGNPTPTPSPTATPTLTPAPTPTPAPPSGWSIVSSPSPVSAQLNAVAAVSANDVWAVGTAGPSTLAEHWNGIRWDIVPTPNRAGSGATQLLGVAAVSANDVWAVGFSDTPYATLAEHWNGSSWSIIPTPNPPVPPYEFSLNAVAAISANDIWAVGGRGYNGHALLEHWDGSTWSIVAAPPSTATWFASSRFGLAAVASNNVWAVGNYDSFHWDGTTWSVVLGAQNTGAASAAGAAGVWAVGTYVDNYYYYYATYTLAYLWNGSSWVQTSTVTPTFLDTFQGVSARASNDVWAVGTTSRTLTLTEHWDGSSWKVEPSPNASTAPNAYHVLRAVVAIASNDAWSVGYYFDGAGNQLTLIEHYAG
jgi:hypothetical protein